MEEKDFFFTLLDQIYNKHLDFDALVNQKLKSGNYNPEMLDVALNNVLKVLNDEYDWINNGTQPEPDEKGTDQVL